VRRPGVPTINWRKVGGTPGGLSAPRGLGQHLHLTEYDPIAGHCHSQGGLMDVDRLYELNSLGYPGTRRIRSRITKVNNDGVSGGAGQGERQ